MIARKLIMELLPEPRDAGDSVLVHGTFVYDSRCPYEVTVVIFDGIALRRTWVLSRDLLLDGLRQPVGGGDVLVLPVRHEHRGDRVELVLRYPGGASVLSLVADSLGDFLTETIEVVEPGKESGYLNIDAGLADLLSLEE
ncbi:SsgA family sporulation/cell division regulator [Kitasatospora sp. NPDC008050]|uniref:SsgA family sporulation/cell division regulator n=1 Tax=Kitasatospora sp. NPDC008050 TaxID=3364021 RepID=UPI0036F1102B